MKEINFIEFYDLPFLVNAKLIDPVSGICVFMRENTNVDVQGVVII